MIGSVVLDPQDLVANAPKLGSPPVVYCRLVDVINDPRSRASDVAEVIAQDTALTARLLKLVNSAFYALKNKVDTVAQAVRIVGTSQIRDLALATSMTTFFVDVPKESIDEEAFWRHSLATGIGARVLADLNGERHTERYFVAGLLHDIGRLVLYVRAPQVAKAFVEHARARDMLLCDAEMEVAGFDHGAIGGALLRRWNMPESLAEPVTLHHRPWEAKEYPLETAIVHVADVLTHGLSLGSSGERLMPICSREAQGRLSIDRDALASVPGEIERQYRELVGLFGLAGEA